MPDADISLDFSRVYDAIDALSECVSGGYAFGPIRDAGEKTIALYSAEEREHFMENSHGGGGWPDLARSTKVKRWRQAGNKGTPTLDVMSLPFPILYITGELYSSLTANVTGNILEYNSDQIIYGTSIFHAVFHQQGTPTEPMRLILLDPQENTLQEIADLHAQALQSVLPRSISI